jgi:Cytochrome c
VYRYDPRIHGAGDGASQPRRLRPAGPPARIAAVAVLLAGVWAVGVVPASAQEATVPAPAAAEEIAPPAAAQEAVPPTEATAPSPPPENAPEAAPVAPEAAAATPAPQPAAPSGAPAPVPSDQTAEAPAPAAPAPPFPEAAPAGAATVAVPEAAPAGTVTEPVPEAPSAEAATAAVPEAAPIPAPPPAAAPKAAPKPAAKEPPKDVAKSAPKPPAAPAPEAPPRPKVDWTKVKNPVAASEASISRGRELYAGKGLCNVCHGDKGDGFGPVRGQFNPFPSAFFDPAWHKDISDGEIMGVLQDGKFGTGMVPIVPDFLTEAEGWDVINYLRTLRGKTTEPYERYQAALRDLRSGAPAEGQTAPAATKAPAAAPAPAAPAGTP